MIRFNRGVAVILGVLVLKAVGAAPRGAEIFAPGTVSGPGSNIAPAFSPDGSTVLFTHRTAAGSAIMIATRTPSGWSVPVIAPFSGHWFDLELAVSEEGTYAIYASNRPATGTTPIEAHYAGGAQIGGNLWRVDFAQGAWGEPRRLPVNINVSTSTWTPSLARNGDLYFMSTDVHTGRFRLHVGPAEAYGRFGALRNVAFSDGTFNDVDPAVDPAQRFLIFSSDRASPGLGDQAGPERLFIAFRPRTAAPLVCPLWIAGWEDPSLSQVEARLSRDGRTLYFASRRPPSQDVSLGPWDDGKAKIWQTPLLPSLWRAAPGTSDVCRGAQI